MWPLINFLALLWLAYCCVVIALSFVFRDYFRTHTIWYCIALMLRKRAFKELAIFVITNLVFNVPSRTLYYLEDLFIPKLKEIKAEYFQNPDKVVFICGHARSGTTNLHKCLTSRSNTVCGFQADILMSSVVQKYLLSPLIKIFDKIVFKCFVDTNSPNHSISGHQELEEDWVAICYAEQSSVGLPIFKTLGEDLHWVNRSIKF